MEFPCAITSGDYLSTDNVLDGMLPTSLFRFAIHQREPGPDTTEWVAYITITELDALIDHLISLRAGPLSKLAIAASKKEKP